MPKFRIIFGCLSGLILIFAEALQAQCLNNVSHLNGTQTVNCVDVTVAVAGSSLNGNDCGIGPYWVGQFANGSYTFDFSETITGVTIDVTAINSNFPPNAREELSVSINGAFYPITQPGVPTNCPGRDPAEISPTGTITGCNNCLSTWEDITIIEPINTITIESIFISGGPGGIIFSLYICCCETDAGEINSNPLNLCPDDIATVPVAQQTNLDADDLLQYILFSDINDTLGSIISTSNTPNFFFNPANMQLGTSYYIAAIAGNNVGGNVDLTDNCLDISNAIEIIWNPYPSVTFSVSDPDVCAGNCTDVTATFTGTPPFTLSYTTPGNPPAILSFISNTGTFQVCVGVGAPVGSFELQATDLIDANCGCN
jgi:hypothetical protein